MAYPWRATHRVEIARAATICSSLRVLGAKRINAAQPEKPADRPRSHVLNGSVETVHEYDRRDAGRRDLGYPAGQNHVNDDGIDVVPPRDFHHAVTKPTVGCDSGEVRHDGRQRPLDGGIEMPSSW